MTVHSGREGYRAGGTAILAPGSRERSRNVGHWQGSRFVRHDEKAREYAGVLRGHFAVFDQWTLINSSTEGRFMERLARGCFCEGVRGQHWSIRCLFAHGHDPR